VFVIAAAIHAPLGLRAIVDEWLHVRGRVVDLLLAAFAAVLLGLGLFAVQSLAR
jgi:fumarate reductase subunit C